MNVGIVGSAGIVGTATARGFEKKHKLFLYDKFKESNSSPKEIAQNTQVVFICVPTPMLKSGKIDLSAVYESVKVLNEYLSPEDDTVIVDPCTYNENINFGAGAASTVRRRGFGVLA